MLNPIEINFKLDKTIKRAHSTEMMIKSHDINVIEFHISFDGLELTAEHTVKVLSVFNDTKSQTNVICDIVDGKAIYRPDTSIISQYEHVLNYVYVYHGNQSLDVRLFTYSVDSSEIDKTAIKVKTVYDQSYAELLTEFEARLQDYKDSLPQADSVRAEIDVILNKFGVDSQSAIDYLGEVSTAAEIAEAERKEAELLREENYNQKVDTAIVEADVVSKVDNKVTELAPQITNLTAQLAQKIGGGVKANLEIFDEETLNFIHDGTGGPIEIGHVPQNGSVSPIKTTFFDLSDNLFDPNKVLENTIASSSGNIYDATRWLNDDFIPVEVGDVIHVSPQNAANRIFTFLSDGSYNGVVSADSYTVTSSLIKFVKIASTTDYTKVMLNKGPQALPYKPYGDRLKEEYLPDIVGHKFSELDKLKANEKHLYYTVEYEEGNINADGSLGTSTQAYRPKAPIELDKGDLLTVSEGYRVFIVAKNTEDEIVSAVWLPALSEYRAEESVIVHFMARTSENLKPETIGDFVLIKKSDNIVTFGELTSMPVAKNVKYVSLGGSDSNDGDSLSKAFKTLQRALDVGAETIYIQRGNYFNQSAKTTQAIDKLTILPADDGNEKVNFIGGDKLEGWIEDGAIFKRTLAGGVNFDEVFISKILPPMTATSRPAPNAVLWESLDFEIDYMMTPVLTLSECQTTQGTFYWDGSYIYINPKSIDNDFWLPQIQNGINLSNVNHLIGQDLCADYYLNQPMRLESIKKLDISGFEAHHSAKTDGFSLDYTYGDLWNCKAYKNRNDGYNNHIEGHVNLHNCEGINNFDDGASPHENCSMTVYGGIYRGNAKGGVIPANGATARVYNAILENNGKGFHNADTSLGKSISSGNLYIGNTIAIQNDNDNDFVSINDKFIDNTTDTVGTVDRY